jgi:hypothetical protein
MDKLLIIGVFAAAALLVAWIANGLVGLLMGEKPGDTGSIWLDVFLRFFAILELGFVGRLLGYVGLNGWPRRIVLLIGLFSLLWFLFRPHHHPRPPENIRSYPVHSSS